MKLKILVLGATGMIGHQVYNYLDKTDKTGRFVAVTVRYLHKLKKPVNLDEIKKNKQLSHLALIKQSRLSVMPIDSKSWKILNKMGKT